MAANTEKNVSKAKAKGNLISSFVVGARSGLKMSLNNMAPNVLFAFALIQILNLSGLSDLISKICGPIMGIFGLPGIAATVVVTALLSTGGGIGAAASLALSGDINGGQAAVLLVGIMTFGSCLQYMGRILGSADVDGKHYPILVSSYILCGFLAMIVMNLIMGF